MFFSGEMALTPLPPPPALGAWLQVVAIRPSEDDLLVYCLDQYGQVWVFRAIASYRYGSYVWPQ